MHCGKYLLRHTPMSSLPDHDYERFAPINADGAANPEGVTQFVAGTGGRSHYKFGTPEPTSKVRITGRDGVLRLQLTKKGWEFMAAPKGEVLDRGTRRCHRAAGHPAGEVSFLHINADIDRSCTQRRPTAVWVCGRST
jgi:hypothetical protein